VAQVEENTTRFTPASSSVSKSACACVKLLSK